MRSINDIELAADNFVDDKTNNHINTNCHLHHWHAQSVTEDLHALTMFQPCRHIMILCDIMCKRSFAMSNLRWFMELLKCLVALAYVIISMNF